MQGTKERQMYAERRSPWVVEPVSEDRQLPRLVENHRDYLESRLLEHGALLFRGFDVGSVESFSRFTDAVSPKKADYVYRSTPRTSMGHGVFTSTEYPPSQQIALHCENAYQREWPLKIAFCCLLPAATGGETPIADMRQVTRDIGEDLLAKFEALQVRYVRHYRPHVDIPWEVVFQTSQRNEVAAFCQRHDIEHDWLDADTLRTAQTNQGVGRHPLTGEKVFFNQAHLFHVSNHDADLVESLVDLFGEDGLPRNAYHGDGTELVPGELQRIRDAHQKNLISFPWQQGDVLLLDNMQFAHGRNSFTGKRQVVASLLEPYSAGGH